ncbi:MAG: twin-arginine translocase subunit TatC [Flavobacteriaceae bacterium]|jgi:sec-independent protein translocase protein TatC|nr:twin-arginine translocase subunit TatC [Flavobacteriaceae bacterium]
MSDKSSMLAQLGMVRNILLRAILVLIVIFIGLTFFQDLIYLKISEPLIQLLPKDSSMIATGVAAPFLTPLKLTFYSAIFFALPYLAIEFWNFISPGLYKKEKILYVSLTLISVLLFYAGMTFAFYVVFPLIFSFFIQAAPEGVMVMTDISNYLDFIIKLFFAFGLAFEMPIIIFALVWSGIVTTEKLANGRPFVIIGCFVVGMLLTPPDIVSQTLLAVPTWFLFEIGLLATKIFIRN